MLDINLSPPFYADKEKAHHVGANTTHPSHSPTSFKNPWPSFDQSHGGPLALLKCRFAYDRPPFVPVPDDRSELVPVRKPDFTPPTSGFKATWLGHAGFVMQCAPVGGERGINILCDPVFSERTSPVQFFGPKRYTPSPCTLDELADAIPVDLILISHNHYDHADAATLQHFHHKRGKEIRFVAALGNSRWLKGLGIHHEQIQEVDWWDAMNISLNDGKQAEEATLRITCTPTQHFSARGPFDRNQDLWCSYALEDVTSRKKIFFAGDTAYRSIPHNDLSEEEEAKYPQCPAFKQIGDLLGPFDLALLPIGLCEPRSFMSAVHCNQRDSIHVHKDVRSRRSVGMHWGTVRGGLSSQYEDVRDPPRKWKEVAMEKGYRWREKGMGEKEEWEVGVMDVGEGLVV